MDTQPLASIPYSEDRAIEYYPDRVIFDGKEIYYEDITGYGYSLKTFSYSLYFIPMYNSKTVSLYISVGDDKRPISFSRRVIMPFGFHSQKQNDLSIIFSEIVSITNAVLGQSVLTKLCDKIKLGESLNIGGLIIENDRVRARGTFKDRELSHYGRTYMSLGRMVVEDGNGKQFYSTPLSNINVPILGRLLDLIYEK